MYGAQAASDDNTARPKFENDVEMYGAQAMERWQSCVLCLRMM